MNLICKFATAAFTLFVASSALAQPALDRVEAQIRRQAQTGGAPQPAAGAPAPGKQPGYLGVIADDREDKGRGARLVEVVAGGPAAKAGLKVGDLITSINDQPVRELDSMQRLLELRPAGAVVSMHVTRDGGDRQISVTLGERPAADKRQLPQFGKQPDELPPPAGAQNGAPIGGDPLILRTNRPLLGIRTLPITPEAQQQLNLSDMAGAFVSAVNPGSPAEKAGVPLGAVIVAVDGQPVDGPQSLADLIRQSKVGDTVDLSCIIRGQEEHKRVLLAAAPPVPQSQLPQPQIRSKPVPTPLDVPTASPPGFVPQQVPGVGPALAPSADDPRIEVLEQRIADLEARVEKLEKQLRDQ